MQYGLGEAVLTSIFSMIIVFLILIILAGIISLFKYLGSDEQPEKAPAKAAKKPAVAAAGAASAAGIDSRLIAMLTAASVVQEETQGDVRIISCEQVR